MEIKRWQFDGISKTYGLVAAGESPTIGEKRKFEGASQGIGIDMKKQAKRGTTVQFNCGEKVTYYDKIDEELSKNSNDHSTFRPKRL